ncbi:hypothetical protein HDU97_004845 [Phlyctochytrium planicorne]|nr:hypothetical protein HDU97_004845 [Phlyctochytrium planicorne]
MFSSIVRTVLTERMNTQIEIEFVDALTQDVFYSNRRPQSDDPTDSFQTPTLIRNSLITIGTRPLRLQCEGTPTGTATPIALLVALLFVMISGSTLFTFILSRFLTATSKARRRARRVKMLERRREVVRVRASAVVRAISDPMVVFEGGAGLIVGANKEAEKACGYEETGFVVWDAGRDTKKGADGATTNGEGKEPLKHHQRSSLGRPKTNENPQPPPLSINQLFRSPPLSTLSTDGEISLSRPPSPFYEHSNPQTDHTIWTTPGIRPIIVTRRDGTTFNAEANFSTVRGLGEVWVVIFRDVTMKLRQKRELEMARWEAEEANRTKSNFLAWICHELRNPLHAVIGLTDIAGEVVSQLGTYLGACLTSGNPKPTPQTPQTQFLQIQNTPSEQLNKPTLTASTRQKVLAREDTLHNPPQNPTAPLLLETKVNLHAISTASKVMSNIINDVLDLSKLEAGRMEMERIPLHVAEIVAQACEGQVAALRVTKKDAVVEGDGIQLLHEVVGKGFEEMFGGDGDSLVEVLEMPERLLGDPTRLLQILTNLIGNSMKFTRKGYVKVKAMCLSENNALENSSSFAIPPPATLAAPFGSHNLEGLGKIRTVRFVVEDTGIGIREEEIPKLFKSYSQANASIGRIFGGTGLGLSIVQHFVHQMGGTIHIRSRINVGTSIWFDLPMPEAPPTPALPPVQTPPEPPTHAGRNQILLVEDNVLLQKVGMKQLEKEGFKVCVASDGLEAIEMLEKSMKGVGVIFDVILMDLQMPRMDGIEAIQEIRKRGWDLPVLALTANALESKMLSAFNRDRQKCASCGFDGFLTKPFNFREFTKAIDSIMILKNKAKPADQTT